jgi:predicted transport protein
MSDAENSLSVKMMAKALDAVERGKLQSVTVVGIRPDGEVAVATVNTSRLAMIGALMTAAQGMAANKAGNLYLLTDEENW